MNREQDAAQLSLLSDLEAPAMTDTPPADNGWSMAALSAIEAMARTGRIFQTADVAREYKLPDPPHKNMWGSIMRHAHDTGVIEKVGTTTSARRSVNSSLVFLWRGVADQLPADDAQRKAS